MTNSQQTAQTILQQLGGNKFLAMTGAKNLTHHTTERGVQLGFKFPGSKVANYCRITLRCDDTYTMEFLKLRAHNFKCAGSFPGLYNDMLASTFESVTGLRTSLTRAA